MNEPKLVIVIATKNRRTLLERALKSVLSQSYKNFRVVVVNDGSTDETRDYLNNLNDARVLVIHHDKSLGVNAARNKALKTLKGGEWAVQLDDDDFSLDGSFEIIANAIKSVPDKVEVLCFNSITRTPKEEFASGYQFKEGEKWYEPSYFEMITKDIRMKGENCAVWKWTLFPKYLFFEKVNGFEHIHWMELARDGVVIRFLPEKTTVIDWLHDQSHLSNTAARSNPKSFAEAHKKILAEHSNFFAKHPDIGMSRSFHAMKISVRAMSPFYTAFFIGKFIKFTLRITFSFFGK